MKNNLPLILKKYQSEFCDVVEFNSKFEKLVALDFTKNNLEFSTNIFENIYLFSSYIIKKLTQYDAKFGIGGYLELREVYSRSNLFDGNNVQQEHRRLHLGTDIWGLVNTKIFSPLDAEVHSFSNNNQNGDYGATIILKHQLDKINFYTLYGHLSLKDINHLEKGTSIKKGEHFAHFGNPSENGNWPPHLHFQIINDLENCSGDYSGVCALSQEGKYAKNCPNPDLILQLNQFC